MSDSRLSEELAKVVNRLTDRFLPESVRPRGLGEEIAIWFSTVIGTIFWVGAMVLYLADNEPGFLSPDNRLAFTGLSSAACILSIWLIMSSFDRGRPLTYFFLGLTVPILTFRILSLGFPWE